ncbi:zinc finger protein 391 isoform X1 [Phyllopteryx taeniolatus]|uniref:zinc finger protein 391 isoform X1 n=1 Tax=Phyllopteryx taeniolatus TaxID=161469 RepID=UPI002AD2828E|nr:zinc finger protein 391 isoform X1 [Phyllopteryx taeniolatus]
MDKDKNHDIPELSSWMEMHQFIGDLLASSSGSSAKEQANVMNAWSTLGGDTFQQRARPMHDKTEAALRKSKHIDDVHHVCTCPGCPFSPRQASYSLLHSEAPKERGTSTAGTRNSLPLSSADGCPEPSGSSESRPDAETPPSRLSSFSRLSSVFPCSAFCHTHHHFHHHHCPISTCLPCPPPPFPCLASFQPCPHQRGAEERGRPAMAASSHPCMHCSASFSRPSQLLQHQRAEHTHKPSGFLCMQCGRTFNSHSNLRIHLHVHTGARPYTCCDCGKGFSQSGALKIHRRIHTGERPYSCGFCGRGFPHLAGVRAHQRIHTGEKPYRCSECGKCFTQSGALKIHIRIHTGERPFVCNICDKAFSNRSGIRFHNQTVHGLAPEQAGLAGAPLGRPRAYPPAGLLNTLHGPDSGTSSQTGSQSGFTLLGGNTSKCQTEGESARLTYACEDCGLRFKDAPSRNRHQTVVHYSAEEGPAKEASTNEGVTHDSGE